MRRLVSWTRTYKKSALVADSCDGEKPTSDFELLGVEMVKDSLPLYDNGVFFVVDSVKGLVFDVIGPENKRYRSVQLDFEEAITIADDFKKLYKEVNYGF